LETNPERHDVHSDGYTVEPDGRDLAEAIREAFTSHLSQGILAPRLAALSANKPNEREIVISLASSSPAEQERIEGLKSIFLAAKKLLDLEAKGASIVETSLARSELNKAYDAFAAKYGPINKAPTSACWGILMKLPS